MTTVGDAPQNNYLSLLQKIADEDVNGLIIAEKSYGGSWKRRGGVGAFMMLARKWDRLENHVSRNAKGAETYNIFQHLEVDTRGEGLIDDIRDLRRYLLLVEAELTHRGVPFGGHRDNVT